MRSRLAVALLLLPLLGACAENGGGTGAPARSAVDVVRLAGSSTVEAGTARMAMSVQGSGVDLTGTGVVELDGSAGDLTMTMTMGGQSLETRMLMIGPVIYLRLPAAAHAPKPWVKADLEQLGAQAGIDIAALQQLSQANPTQALAYLAGVSDDVTEVGEETLRGARTTKYTATFDLTKARDAQTDPDVRTALDGLIEQLGTSTLPATVWVDDEGRMRKLEQTVDLSTVPAAGGATGTMITAFEVYDFGVAVDVQAPPADQVGDFADVIGG